jgi:hypothetical protein
MAAAASHHGTVATAAAAAAADWQIRYTACCPLSRLAVSSAPSFVAQQSFWLLLKLMFIISLTLHVLSRAATRL